MKRISTLVLALVAVSSSAIAAPEISGVVSISNNKATRIFAIGGDAGAVRIGGVRGAGATLNGVANVNSLVMYDANARVSGVVSIRGNEATDVYAVGGTANVNSVVMGVAAPQQ